MSLHDPGAHTKRRNYRFLPYHWRRFQRWQHSVGPTMAACTIVGALICCAMGALLLNSLVPSSVAMDETASGRIRTGALLLTVVLGTVGSVYAMLRFSR